MVRLETKQTGNRRCFPPARGDGPVARVELIQRIPFPPRPGGWSVLKEVHIRPFAVSPPPGGMVRRRPPRPRPSRGFPPVRGDGPQLDWLGVPGGLGRPDLRVETQDQLRPQCHPVALDQPGFGIEEQRRRALDALGLNEVIRPGLPLCFSLFAVNAPDRVTPTLAQALVRLQAFAEAALAPFERTGGTWAAVVLAR